MGPITVIDSIRGESFLAIRLALSVLERRGLNVPAFTLTVVRTGAVTTVLLNGPDPVSKAPTVIGIRAGDATELTPADLAALDAVPADDKHTDGMKGGNWAAVLAAVDIFLKRSPNPDLAQYKLQVARERETIIVMFADRDLKPGTYGAIRGRPGFEVVLRDKDLSFIRSNFVR